MPSVPWGTHIEFVKHYDEYTLETLHGPEGRAALVESIGSELRTRRATRLLDCAAGTGFPALDLLETTNDQLDVIHTCDGDPVMIRRLARKAKERNIELDAMNPRQRTARTPRQKVDDFVINWRDLRVVRGTYDYVLCRGNALAYADSWSGEGTVSSRDSIRDYLAQMAARIEPGGHLHIDAPWRLTPRDGPSVIVDRDDLRITEEIKDHDDHREWLVNFRRTDGTNSNSEIAFRRLSSRLTIHDVREELNELNLFDDPEPFQLEAERKVYGTIIARKVM